MESAGRLEPGANYVYERDGSRIYARKIGETQRILIGEDYALDISRRRLELSETWVPILEAAEHNPALQDALDRAKLVYELSKEHNTVMHHPV
jgi:hypothetical protein